ncbi:DUF6249 domain-containing protein [Parapedobacter tibetensis]|uniref:DUF6249 domain-containing protein n=1 Tax=Parapedobacter tibetensis TaxID=2972951 RepID=UPI00214D26FC|nr:DUF6249 domain-containing protein [Parapedobacter tibetensis]
MVGIGLVIVAFLVTAAFTIFYVVKSRHIERMSKIEHGIISDDEPSPPNSQALSFGIFFFALGLAVFISYLVSTYTSIPNYITMPGFLLLFGGLGFIISYMVNKKKNR